MATEATQGLSFDGLRKANVERSELIYHGEAGIKEWTPSDWATAMAGECGEACNEVKKLRRIAATPEDCPRSPPLGKAHSYFTGVIRLKNELADLVIYADLLAARMGIDLGDAIRIKFNNISEENGCEIKV